MFHVSKPGDADTTAATTDAVLAVMCAVTIGEGAVIKARKRIETVTGYKQVIDIVLFVCPRYASHEEHPDTSVLGFDVARRAEANDCVPTP